jgi:ABC-2 type transport system permease protein/oleandomycin transport system permease protein
MAQQVLTRTQEINQYTEASLWQKVQWNIQDTLVMTRRNILHNIRIPQLLVFATIQPVMFLLLFAYVFGGAIATSNGDYINFLIPGIITQTVIFGATQTTIGLAEDMSRGMIDRFRSLPMARAAVLAGRTLSDSIRNIFVVVLMITVGYIIGFRFQGNIIDAILMIGIVVLFGYAFTWISALIGLLVKDPETAQVAGFIWVFPLVFASTVFEPVETMTSCLQKFAENQPITAVVNTARALTLDTPVGDWWWKALLWIALILAVFMPLAVRQYRKTTS